MMASAEEQAVNNEIMEMMEATPGSSAPSSLLQPFTGADDTPAKREKLAVLVSTGKSKEAIGVQLTHDAVKRLSDKDVEKYTKRYEAYVGNKTTESLVDSLIMLVSKGVGMVVQLDDVEKLQKELKNDYVINQELSSLAGGLALRFGRLLALANAALIITKHVVFAKKEEAVAIETPPAPPTARTSTGDSDGRPLMGFDEVDGPVRNLEETCEEPDWNLGGLIEESDIY